MTDSLSRILFVAIGSALAVAAGFVAFLILITLATGG